MLIIFLRQILARRLDSEQNFARVFIANVGYEKSVIVCYFFGGKQIRISPDYELKTGLTKALGDLDLPKILFEKYGGKIISIPKIKNLQKWKRENMRISEEDIADKL
jgi:hypothetical protein